jgi:hypothetical protein
MDIGKELMGNLIRLADLILNDRHSTDHNSIVASRVSRAVISHINQLLLVCLVVKFYLFIVFPFLSNGLVCICFLA